MKRVEEKEKKKESARNADRSRDLQIFSLTCEQFRMEVLLGIMLGKAEDTAEFYLRSPN